MSKPWSLMFVVLTAVAAQTVEGAPAAEPAGAATAKKLKVLVVSGGHGFPVPPFRKVFEGYQDMDCTFVDEKTGGEAFEDIAGWDYDAIVLYNYMKKPSDNAWKNFTGLLDRGVGLVILHHAIYGYRPRPEFMKIVGVTSWLTGAKHGVDFKVHVEDPKHPITRGLADFSIHDETYQGHGLDPKCHVILSTDAPTNEKWVAWVHTYGKSPVCYFQLGHDTNAYANDSYVTILGCAIRWSAGRSNAPETTGSTPRPGTVSARVRKVGAGGPAARVDDPASACRPAVSTIYSALRFSTASSILLRLVFIFSPTIIMIFPD